MQAGKTSYILKVPSLFAAWLFWTFHTIWFIIKSSQKSCKEQRRMLLRFWPGLLGECTCSCSRPLNWFIAFFWRGECPGGGGGGVHPYLGIVGRFRGDDPRFWDFQSDWVPILYLNTMRLQKNSVCLSHI